MIRPLAIVPLFLFIFTATALPGRTMAAGTEDARQYVDTVGKHVLEVINGSGDEKQRHSQLEQMFTENVDIDWMGHFVVGRGWQQANDDQRRRYMQAYKHYLLAHYTSKFSSYTGSKYTITDVKDEGNGQFTVSMKIKIPGTGEDTNAGYRLKSDNGQFKIIDIIVEGVSLITTERSEFSSVLQQKGMDGLVSALEAKAGTEEKKS